MKNVRNLASLASAGLLMINGLEAKALSLVSYWDFNEGSGSTVYDITRNGNDGTLQGNVSWTDDSISGTALDFNGGQVRVTGSYNSLDLAELTIEACVKRESANNSIIVGKNAQYVLGIKDNKIYGDLNIIMGRQGLAVQGATPLEEGIWYKLKITYDGLEFKSYVNDVQDGYSTINQQNTIQSSLRDVYFSGTDEPSHPLFYGLLDEVKVYDSASVPRDISDSDIPEPSTYGLITGLGCLGAAFAKRISKKPSV